MSRPEHAQRELDLDLDALDGLSSSLGRSLGTASASASGSASASASINSNARLRNDYDDDDDSDSSSNSATSVVRPSSHGHAHGHSQARRQAHSHAHSQSHSMSPQAHLTQLAHSGALSHESIPARGLLMAMLPCCPRAPPASAARARAIAVALAATVTIALVGLYLYAAALTNAANAAAAAAGQGDSGGGGALSASPSSWVETQGQAQSLPPTRAHMLLHLDDSQQKQQQTSSRQQPLFALASAPPAFLYRAGGGVSRLTATATASASGSGSGSSDSSSASVAVDMARARARVSSARLTLGMGAVTHNLGMHNAVTHNVDNAGGLAQGRLDFGSEADALLAELVLGLEPGLTRPGVSAPLDGLGAPLAGVSEGALDALLYGTSLLTVTPVGLPQGVSVSTAPAIAVAPAGAGSAGHLDGAKGGATAPAPAAAAVFSPLHQAGSPFALSSASAVVSSNSNSNSNDKDTVITLNADYSYSYSNSDGASVSASASVKAWVAGVVSQAASTQRQAAFSALHRYGCLNMNATDSGAGAGSVRSLLCAAAAAAQPAALSGLAAAAAKAADTRGRGSAADLSASATDLSAWPGWLAAQAAPTLTLAPLGLASPPAPRAPVPVQSVSGSRPSSNSRSQSQSQSVSHGFRWPVVAAPALSAPAAAAATAWPFALPTYTDVNAGSGVSGGLSTSAVTMVAMAQFMPAQTTLTLAPEPEPEPLTSNLSGSVRGVNAAMQLLSSFLAPNNTSSADSNVDANAKANYDVTAKANSAVCERFERTNPACDPFNSHIYALLALQLQQQQQQPLSVPAGDGGGDNDSDGAIARLQLLHRLWRAAAAAATAHEANAYAGHFFGPALASPVVTPGGSLLDDDEYFALVNRGLSNLGDDDSQGNFHDDESDVDIVGNDEEYGKNAQNALSGGVARALSRFEVVNAVNHAADAVQRVNDSSSAAAKNSRASSSAASLSRPSLLRSRRPPPRQRRFRSPGADALARALSARAGDAVLGWVAAQALPSTLDSTVELREEGWGATGAAASRALANAVAAAQSRAERARGRALRRLRDKSKSKSKSKNEGVGAGAGVGKARTLSELFNELRSQNDGKRDTDPANADATYNNNNDDDDDDAEEDDADEEQSSSFVLSAASRLLNLLSQAASAANTHTRTNNANANANTISVSAAVSEMQAAVTAAPAAARALATAALVEALLHSGGLTSPAHGGLTSRQSDAPVEVTEHNVEALIKAAAEAEAAAAAATAAAAALPPLPALAAAAAAAANTLAAVANANAEISSKAKNNNVITANSDIDTNLDSETHDSERTGPWHLLTAGGPVGAAAAGSALASWVRDGLGGMPSFFPNPLLEHAAVRFAHSSVALRQLRKAQEARKLQKQQQQQQGQSQIQSQSGGGLTFLSSFAAEVETANDMPSLHRRKLNRSSNNNNNNNSKLQSKLQSKSQSQSKSRSQSSFSSQSHQQQLCRAAARARALPLAAGAAGRYWAEQRGGSHGAGGSICLGLPSAAAAAAKRGGRGDDWWRTRKEAESLRMDDGYDDEEEAEDGDEEDEDINYSIDANGGNGDDDDRGPGSEELRLWPGLAGPPYLALSDLVAHQTNNNLTASSVSSSPSLSTLDGRLLAAVPDLAPLTQPSKYPTAEFKIKPYRRSFETAAAADAAATALSALTTSAASAAEASAVNAETVDAAAVRAESAGARVPRARAAVAQSLRTLYGLPAFDHSAAGTSAQNARSEGSTASTGNTASATASAVSGVIAVWAAGHRGGYAAQSQAAAVLRAVLLDLLPARPNFDHDHSASASPSESAIASSDAAPEPGALLPLALLPLYPYLVSSLPLPPPPGVFVRSPPASASLPSQSAASAGGVGAEAAAAAGAAAKLSAQASLDHAAGKLDSTASNADSDANSDANSGKESIVEPAANASDDGDDAHVDTRPTGAPSSSSSDSDAAAADGTGTGRLGDRPVDVRSVPLPTFPLAFAPAPARAFVTTGDIPAMWLRDSTNQLLSFVSLLSSDAALRRLARATIATQAALVLADPLANAFRSPAAARSQPAARGGFRGARAPGGSRDGREPEEGPLVFEGKFELDSLAAFLQLAGEYYERTGDLSVATGPVGAALEAAARVVARMREGGEQESGGGRSGVDFAQLRSTVNNDRHDNAGRGRSGGDMCWADDGIDLVSTSSSSSSSSSARARSDEVCARVNSLSHGFGFSASSASGASALSPAALRGQSSAAPWYRWNRVNTRQTETQYEHGYGYPARSCGLSRSFFRPSDDSQQLPYLVPANAHVTVALRKAAVLAADAHNSLLGAWAAQVKRRANSDSGSKTTTSSSAGSSSAGSARVDGGAGVSALLAHARLSAHHTHGQARRDAGLSRALKQQRLQQQKLQQGQLQQQQSTAAGSIGDDSQLAQHGRLRGGYALRPHLSVRVPVHLPADLTTNENANSSASASLLKRLSAPFVPAGAAYAVLHSSMIDLPPTSSNSSSSNGAKSATGAGEREQLRVLFMYPDNTLHSALAATRDAGTHVALLSARAAAARDAAVWGSAFGAFARPRFAPAPAPASASASSSHATRNDSDEDEDEAEEGYDDDYALLSRRARSSSGGGNGGNGGEEAWTRAPSAPHLHPLTATPLTGPSSWAVLAARLDLLADEVDRGVRECGAVLKPSPAAAAFDADTTAAGALLRKQGADKSSKSAKGKSARDKSGDDESEFAFEYEYAVEPAPAYLSYEVDGYGSSQFLDDANLPSLLSLPHLSYLSPYAPAYAATRARALSPRWNPYYFRGAHVSGVGGPHIGLQWVWPMSLIVQGLTLPAPSRIEAARPPERWDATDRAVARLLATLTRMALTGGSDEPGQGYGFIKESILVQDGPTEKLSEFTRPWFAWANGLFGELVLHVARTRPYLVFHPNATTGAVYNLPQKKKKSVT